MDRRQDGEKREVKRGDSGHKSWWLNDRVFVLSSELSFKLGDSNDRFCVLSSGLSFELGDCRCTNATSEL
jgi:hypothetical protein